MPFPVQIRRFSTALLKYFGLQGNLGLTLLEDIQPVVVVGRSDDTPQAITRGENPWGRTILQAAVVAQFSQIRLVNPADSGRLLLVDLIVLNQPAGGAVLGVEFLASAGGGHILVPRDSRLTTSIPSRSVGTLTSTTNAVSFFATSVSMLNLVAGPSQDRVSPALLIAPGTSLLLESTVVNVNLGASIWWTEIPLAPQDLSV